VGQLLPSLSMEQPVQLYLHPLVTSSVKSMSFLMLSSFMG
jgi:hypothetical protein